MELSRKAIDERRPIFSQMFVGRDEQPVSVLKVPLVVGGEVDGVLEVEWGGAHVESPREISLLTVAADRIASGISNARAYESVKRSERLANEERSRLRTIIDTLPVGILIIDGSGRQIESNALRSKIWGGTPRPSTSIDDVCQVRAWGGLGNTSDISFAGLRIPYGIEAM